MKLRELDGIKEDLGKALLVGLVLAVVLLLLWGFYYVVSFGGGS